MGTIPSAVTGLSTTGGTLTGPLVISGAFPAGGALQVTNTSVAPTAPTVEVTSAAVGDNALAVNVTGDATTRWRVTSGGQNLDGPGAGGGDTQWGRTAANVLGLTATDLDVVTGGRGLRVSEAANGKQGTAVLVGGTVTVANTSVTANSRIFLTSNADGGTPGFQRVSARTAATSFTITSSSGTDTSTIAFEIFEPG